MPPEKWNRALFFHEYYYIQLSAGFPAAKWSKLPEFCPKFLWKREKTIAKAMVFQWQPDKDSNPDKQSQSLSCYHYTIRLSSPCGGPDRC